MSRKLRDRRLYWRGGKIWCRVPAASGRIIRKSTRCRDEAAAVLRANELERRYADPRHAAAAAASLEGSIRALLKDMIRRGRAKATLDIASQKLGHFARLWGKGLAMADIGPELVLEYVDKRKGELVEDFTIAKELQHLGMMLKLARFRGVFHRDPAEVIPPWSGKGGTPRKARITQEQAATLLPEFERRRAAHIAFFLGTGARRSEARRAHREDIDVGTRKVHVRGTKTEAADDDVPITVLTGPFVAFALEYAPGGTGKPLFAPWGNLSRDLKAACVRAGLPELTPNDLRRSFGWWHRQALIAEGRSEKSAAEIVARLLRHTTDKLAQTTYAKLESEAAGTAVESVLGLYLETAPNGDQRAPTDHENAEETGATHGIRTHDLRFTKPFAERVSRGTKLGLLRAAEKDRVPEVYADGVSQPYLWAALCGVLRWRLAELVIEGGAA